MSLFDFRLFGTFILWLHLFYVVSFSRLQISKDGEHLQFIFWTQCLVECMGHGRPKTVLFFPESSHCFLRSVGKYRK